MDADELVPMFDVRDTEDRDALKEYVLTEPDMVDVMGQGGWVRMYHPRMDQHGRIITGTARFVTACGSD